MMSDAEPPAGPASRIFSPLPAGGSSRTVTEARRRLWIGLAAALAIAGLALLDAWVVPRDRWRSEVAPTWAAWFFSPVERNPLLRLPAVASELRAFVVTADGHRAWAVGGAGTIVVTRDGGATWMAQASGTSGDLTDVAAAEDGQRAWAEGGDGTIVATRDGGATWMAQASGTKAALWGVAAAEDGQRAWAVGLDGTIVATRDGGATWTMQASGTSEHLTGVAAAEDGQRAWA